MLQFSILATKSAVKGFGIDAKKTLQLVLFVIGLSLNLSQDLITFFFELNFSFDCVKGMWSVFQ